MDQAKDDLLWADTAVTDLLGPLHPHPAQNRICIHSCVGGYMCPHLPFWGGTSAQDDLNSWPLPRPKLLQVVVIKIRPFAVQETILMTTWLHEGVSAAHLAEGGPARRLTAPWLLVRRSKEWFSHRSESSSVLWQTLLSLLENVTESWAVELWHQWRRRWCSFP